MAFYISLGLHVRGLGRTSLLLPKPKNTSIPGAARTYARTTSGYQTIVRMKIFLIRHAECLQNVGLAEYVYCTIIFLFCSETDLSYYDVDQEMKVIPV